MYRDTPSKFFMAALLGLLLIFSLQAEANVTFTFKQTVGTVTMTSSGTLDTTKLVVSNLSDGWGGTGTENNADGDIDIMGGTSFGPVDAQFGFSTGTDASAITNPGGPFATDNFSVADIQGSKSFTTYSGLDGDIRAAGIGVVRADIVDGLWTPDQTWTYGPGATIESLGLNPGVYSVSDIETGETITINIGNTTSVPALDMQALILLGVSVLLLGGLMLRRRSVT